MDPQPYSARTLSDQSFWNEAFFRDPVPEASNTPCNPAREPLAASTPNTTDPAATPAQEDLFELWCCSDELCLPFADQNGQICNLSNCPSTAPACFDSHFTPQPANRPAYSPAIPPTTYPSTEPIPCCSAAPCQQDLRDCDCCLAGCPPSPISLQPCIECDQPQQNLPLPRASPSIMTSTTTTTRSGSRLLSPSLASSLSRNDFDDYPPSQAGLNEQLDEEIVWTNQDLEELVRMALPITIRATMPICCSSNPDTCTVLRAHFCGAFQIKCCCCDEPTQSQTLPSHHAQAHPTHRVNFDMFDRPSITLPYRPHRERTEVGSVTPSIPSIDVSCNEGTLATFKCQWKDCNHEFSDRFKLTEHVNVCHLFQHSPAPPNHGTQSESQQLHPSPRIDHQRVLPSDNIASQSGQSTSMSAALSKARLDGLLVSYEASHSSFNRTSNDHSNPAPLVACNQIPPLGHYQSCFDLASHSRDPLVKPNCPVIRVGRDESNNGSAPDSFISPGSPSTAIDPLLRSRPSQNPSTSGALVPQKNIHHQHVCRWGACTRRAFANTAELTEHISTDHVGSGKSHYTCLWEDCYRATKPKSAKGHEHEQEHLNNGEAEIGMENAPGGSDTTRKVFSQRQKLMRHLQTHTGDKPFECESCGKKFGEMTTLVQHRRTHTNEKPYRCLVEGCGKSFALQSALTIHKRTHTGTKPFKCPVKGCAAQFSESSNLSKHMRIHSPVKRFKCTICGKRFGRSDQLSRHLKSESIHLHLGTNSVDRGDDDGEEEEQAPDDDDGPHSQAPDILRSSSLHAPHPHSHRHPAPPGQEKRGGSVHPLGGQPQRKKHVPSGPN